MLLAASCTEDIDFSNEFERKVTVNLILENADTQELTLCYNSDPRDYGGYKAITDAEIILLDGETQVGRFEHAGRLKWRLDYRPVSGHTYRLTVNVPGHDEITAETTMPKNVIIQALTNNPGNTDNLKYFIQKESAAPYWVFVMGRDESDMILNGETVSIKRGDSLEDYVGSNHFAVDHFNMEDALIFSEFGMPGKTFQHLGYLRINETDESADYPVTFFIEARMRNSIAVFRSASDEYDKYMKSSLIKAMAYESNDDPSAYFEENVVYSNIKGGLGIFAACSDTLIARSRAIDHH